MEPRDRAAQTLTSSLRFRWRARLVACSAVLIAIGFAQDSGRVATDTKLDLVVTPWKFLGRALTMWDDQGAFGQLQNQGYGYLFPMGPFFGIFQSLGVPPWVTQRLWWSLILVVAFLGVVKLAGVLRIGAPWARVLAGFAFALSPRFLSVLGPSSIEVWPSAVAPWVLIPLVIGLRRGSPRRNAAFSALAVAAVGGVNAAATFAVVPLAALWLLFAAPGRRRRALMLWWPPLVLAATLWWIVPLFLLGHYSPPFLDYIESVDNTAFSATLFDTLRGTSNWVPYIDANAHAGRDLVSDPLLIVNGVVVLCFGVLGLARRDLPHRRFLTAGLILGLVVVTSGHAGAVAGWFSAEARTLLDGPLAPLRNTHKFDVLLRLPLVLGLCHAVTVLTRRPSGVGDGPAWSVAASRWGPAVLAAAAVVGATVPAWSGTLAPRDSFSAVPDYWRDAADWLGEHQNGRTLLTPATPFGDYVWGKTADEPLQALASAPWAVRNLVPLAPGGNVTALDTISNQLATGRGSEAFASFLRRAGVGTLVVRNDIDRTQGSTSPEAVRQTLATTPGMRRVAAFGPNVTGGSRFSDDADAPFVEAGWQAPRPAIEVFSLDDDVVTTTRQPWSRTPVLLGDSDSLLAADSWGLTGGRAVVMAQDVGSEQRPGRWILGDGNRRQEQAFGAVAHQRSATLTPAERYRQNRRVHRYDQDQMAGLLAVPRLIGAESLTASSSRSDVGAIPGLDQAASPWAAFDSDPDTAWRPDRAEVGKKSWLRLDLGREQDLGAVTIQLVAPSDRSTHLTVTTQDGPQDLRVQGSAPAHVEVGRVRSLTISGSATATQELAISDISSQNLSLSRTLRLATAPEDWGSPNAIVLDSAPEHTDGCTLIDQVIRCSSQEEYLGEGGRTIDREIVLPASRAYDLSVRVQPYGGPALDALLQRDRLATVVASSQVTHGGAASPVRAIDGDSTTGWIASKDDSDPTLTVRWVGERDVSRIRLTTDDDLAASIPAQVRLEFADGSTADAPVEDGVVTFPEHRTSSVAIHVVGTEARGSIGFSGSITTLPVGVSELAVEGVPLRFDADPVVRTFACGSGPTVTAEGTTLRTQVRASLDDLVQGRVVAARPCGDDSAGRLTLGAGVNRVLIGGSAALRPEGVLLRGDTAPTDPAGPELMVTTHNENPGWVATQDGRRLASQVADGWQQAWLVPSAGGVSTSFRPERIYAVGLVLGAVSLVVVALLAWWPARREPDDPPSASARRGGTHRLLPWAVVALGGVIGSWPGCVAAVGALIVAWAADGRREPVRASLAVAAVGLAGLFYVLGPWAGFGGWAGQRATPQLLVVFAMSCLVAADLRRPRSFRRSAGRSTTR